METSTISLAVIDAIAFAVYGYALIKLAPIMQKVFKTEKGKKIQIQEQTWKVNYGLITAVTLPFIGYAGFIALFVWIIVRIVGG